VARKSLAGYRKEIAGVVVLLASEQSSYMTGTCVTRCPSTYAGHRQRLDETACTLDAKSQKELFHDQRGT
jgi:hypothetical protein